MYPFIFCFKKIYSMLNAVSYYAQLSCTTVVQTMWSSSFRWTPRSGGCARTCSLHRHAPWGRHAAPGFSAAIVVRPRLAARLEEDDDRIFKPLTAELLGLWSLLPRQLSAAWCATANVGLLLVCDLYTYTHAVVAGSSIPIPHSFYDDDYTFRTWI